MPELTLRVVFDCNLFVQKIANRNSPARKALRLFFNGDISLFVSQPIIREVREVLNRAELRRKLPSINGHVLFHHTYIRYDVLKSSTEVIHNSCYPFMGSQNTSLGVQRHNAPTKVLQSTKVHLGRYHWSIYQAWSNRSDIACAMENGKPTDFKYSVAKAVSKVGEGARPRAVKA